MPFTVNEADIERVLAENYWKIFHDDEMLPKYLKIDRQVKLTPYGVADIIATYQDFEEPDIERPIGIPPEIHIIEVKACPLKEADLAQAARYYTAISNSYNNAIYANIEIAKDFGFTGHINPYHFKDNVHCTLVGPNNKGSDHPYGSNGDFVFLSQNCDVDVYTFDFKLDGLRFEALSTNWTKCSEDTHVEEFMTKCFDDLHNHKVPPKDIF